MTKLTTVTVDVQDQEKVHRLRLEAAKRGLTRSNYCRLLLEKATNGFTDFDIPGHEIKFKDDLNQRK